MSLGKGIINITLKDRSALHQAYMSFIQHGGLFITTNKAYQLGDAVFMLIVLMNDPQKLAVAGTVVWITPSGAQGGRVPGIGVQFSEQDKGQVRNRIENELAGMMNSDRPTYTL